LIIRKKDQAGATVDGLVPGSYKFMIARPPSSFGELQHMLSEELPLLAAEGASHDTLVLCVHLFSLAEQGLQDFHDFLNRQNLVTTEIRPASCAFPVPVGWKMAWRMLLRVCEVFVLPGHRGLLSQAPVQWIV